MDQIKSIESIGMPIMTHLKKNVVGIDHIAVAVQDLGDALNFACQTLGCTLVEMRETQGRLSGMRSAVLRLGGLVLVLVEGTTDQSQVAQFVAEHGSGVQHIALRVQDLTQAIRELESTGMKFSTPRLDSEGLSQIFSVRDGSTGLMVEFIERRNYDGFSDENVQRLFQSLEARGTY